MERLSHGARSLGGKSHDSCHENYNTIPVFKPLPSKRDMDSGHDNSRGQVLDKNDGAMRRANSQTSELISTFKKTRVGP